MERKQVRCAQGILEAQVCGGVAVFRGVPYAAAPVGALRWREPQPSLPWGGVRPADVFSAMPAQCAGGPESPMGRLYQSEDCLYLNIYAPAEADRPLPVLVWFYGGSYQNGSASDPAFDGANFARLGVITVTVNYRVGIMGFFCHPDMRAESPYGTGGNFGLLDQLASLRWVQENIAAFGGDPGRVTIAGQSAGSASVGNIMAVPMGQGLIHGAICQSGDVFQPERDITFDEAAPDGVKTAEVLGCRSLDELRRLPVSALVKERANAMTEVTGRFCTPVIDGVVIPSAQGDRLLQNRCAQIPVLLGTNLDEGSRTAAVPYIARVSARLGIPTDLYPMDEGADAYANQLARDYWYARHLAWARLRVEKYHLPTYQYVFSRRLDRAGAYHGMEILYAFDTLETAAHLAPLYTPQDRALQQTVSAYWANFIRSGNPNGEGLPAWPSKNEAPAEHMNLDVVCGMQDDVLRPTDRVVGPAVYRWMKARAEG